MHHTFEYICISHILLRRWGKCGRIVSNYCKSLCFIFFYFGWVPCEYAVCKKFWNDLYVQRKLDIGINGGPSVFVSRRCNSCSCKITSEPLPSHTWAEHEQYIPVWWRKNRRNCSKNYLNLLRVFVSNQFIWHRKVSTILSIFYHI